MKITVLQIHYTETFDLRKKVLNPEQPHLLKRPGDETAQHFGAYLAENLVGIISFYEQNQEEVYQEGHWRIRGMAIIPDLQKQGVGSELMCFGLKYLKNIGELKEIWCKSRKEAVPFYRKFDLIVGEKQEKSDLTHPSWILMSTSFSQS